MSPGNIRRGVRYCLDFFIGKREKGEEMKTCFIQNLFLLQKMLFLQNEKIRKF